MRKLTAFITMALLSCAPSQTDDTKIPEVYELNVPEPPPSTTGDTCVGAIRCLNSCKFDGTCDEVCQASFPKSWELAQITLAGCMTIHEHICTTLFDECTEQSRSK